LADETKRRGRRRAVKSGNRSSVAMAMRLQGPESRCRDARISPADQITGNNSSNNNRNNRSRSENQAPALGSNETLRQLNQ